MVGLEGMEAEQSLVATRQVTRGISSVFDADGLVTSETVLKASFAILLSSYTFCPGMSFRSKAR